MTLRCGLIGRPICGKTTVFNAVTSAHASLFDAADAHRAMVSIPDPRVRRLAKVFAPAKVTPAVMELVDIPGLEETSTTEGNRGSRLLTHIKESDMLIHVVRCFENGHPPATPVDDLERVDLALMAADAQTLERKLERLSKRRKTGDKEAVRESDLCGKVLEALHEGVPARRQGLTAAERAAVLDCTLMSLKPVLYVANVESSHEMAGSSVESLQRIAATEGAAVVPICGRDEADIAELPEEERLQFLEELGLHEPSVERLIHAAYGELGLVDFFTAGEKEVRVWTCRAGSLAPAAAGKIHSDMERGFIRMEVIAYGDLIEHGSEEAAIQAGKQRVEGKEYVVQDGDVVVVRFSPPRRR
jgi:ribosome-binding ATPase